MASVFKNHTPSIFTMELAQTGKTTARFRARKDRKDRKAHKGRRESRASEDLKGSRGNRGRRDLREILALKAIRVNKEFRALPEKKELLDLKVRKGPQATTAVLALKAPKGRQAKTPP